MLLLNFFFGMKNAVIIFEGKNNPKVALEYA